MGQDLRYLFEMIRRHHLDDRSNEVRNWLSLMERGLIDDRLARALAIRIQPLLAAQQRRPNFLFRAPDFDELYPDGPPKLVLGHLEENEEVPLGMTPTGAFHCMFAGMTGYGKTVAIHRLIAAIEDFNQTSDQRIVVIVLDYKGGSYSG